MKFVDKCLIKQLKKWSKFPNNMKMYLPLQWLVSKSDTNMRNSKIFEQIILSNVRLINVTRKIWWVVCPCLVVNWLISKNYSIEKFIQLNIWYNLQTNEIDLLIIAWVCVCSYKSLFVQSHFFLSKWFSVYDLKGIKYDGIKECYKKESKKTAPIIIKILNIASFVLFWGSRLELSHAASPVCLTAQAQTWWHLDIFNIPFTLVKGNMSIWKHLRMPNLR